MRTLNRRILTFIILILILFSAIVLGMFRSLTINEAVSIQRQDLEEQALVLTGRLSNQYDSLEEVQNDLQENQEYLFSNLSLLNQQGQVVFDTVNPSLIGTDLSSQDDVSQSINQADMGFAQVDDDGSPLLFTSAPFYLNDGSLGGYVRLYENAERFGNLLRSLTSYLLILLFMGIVLSLSITYYWFKKINAPFNQLKTVISKLVNRDYSARYHAKSYPEIDEMGVSINHLAESLELQDQENQQYDRRMRELVQYLTVGIIFIDESRKIRIVNPAANQILDTNLYSNIGSEYTEHIKSAELVKMIERAIKNKKNYNKEIVLYFQNEHIVDVNVVMIPGKTPDIYNYAVLLYDITEIRRLEKVRTDFVANASHELRTPITALKGFSETLLDGAMEDGEVLKEFLQIMYKESSRLDTMVKDILQLSKLEQKPTNHVTVEVAPKEVILEVLQVLQQKSELKQIHILVNEIDQATIRVNRDEFKQVILNLVGNALSYTPDRGQVEIKMYILDNNYVIQVIDNGIGIPEKDQARIFERFYRVDKARSRNAGGTGLGLSIVKWLVESMNGHIELESQPKEGSTFSVYLPLAENNPYE